MRDYLKEASNELLLCKYEEFSFAVLHNNINRHYLEYIFIKQSRALFLQRIPHQINSVTAPTIVNGQDMQPLIPCNYIINNSNSSTSKSERYGN